MTRWFKRLLIGVAAPVVAVVSLTAGPAAAATPAGEPDIRAALEAVPGLTVTAERPAAAGFRFFELSLRQPVDHHHPGAGTFQQRLTLLHRSADRPTVLATGGYNLPPGQGRSEPTTLLDGNQLTTEQRFFGTSLPSTTGDYRTLDIWQAATDHHRIVEAFRSVYRGRWISTGSSKGGMATVYHRRFYPADVTASVAYGAPNNVNDREDSAYRDFLSSVGTPECRAALRAVQRQALLHREQLTALYTAADPTATFELIGSADKAFEIGVLRTPFAFWQSIGASGCATVPGPEASDQQLYDWLDRTGRLAVYTDGFATDFVPYFYQLGTQLGYFGLETEHLADLIRYPGATEPRTFVPREVALRFQPQAMRDVDRWVRLRGERMLFVQGAADPSVAEPFRLGPGTRDSLSLWLPNGTHAARIAALTPADRDAATAALTRWAGLA
ncbi:S28 family serine protease [Kitasatospora sp. NPDC096147]|uniref:S28 family serine protease n=1 Tax=Kitasatospora sp. NPDC096147 TaxID=3364093 RepID=UPI003800479C